MELIIYRLKQTAGVFEFTTRQLILNHKIRRRTLLRISAADAELRTERMSDLGPVASGMRNLSCWLAAPARRSRHL